MRTLQYENFDLLIEAGGDAFRARVVGSPDGETPSVAFVPPVSAERLELLALKMRTVPGMRAMRTDSVPDARQLGASLFDALFHDEVLDRLRRSLSRTEARGRGLRIRLRFSDAHELWNMPWELLYDSEEHRFLCQFDTTPVVRYVDMAQPVEPLTVTGPIQMLVMISSPTDFPPLDVAKEWAQLAEALRPLEATGSLRVQRLPSASLEDLRRTMMFGEYHVFHYIGHGGLDQNTGEGLLVLTGPDGRARLATGAELYVMLANSPVRLAVLNSCQGARISAIDPYAGAAASLVHQGIPAVVAMQFEISDDAAIAFSRTLYEAISYGWPVDAAVAEARRAILAASRAEWATPVLYLRAADGVLLNTPPPTRTPAPPQPTGLTGSTTDRDVTLQWAPSPAGLSTVPRWEVRRDGTAVTEVTEPHATDQPPPGSHEYTVVAIGTDGQRSTESAAWMAVIPDISSRPPVVPTGLRGSSSKGYVELHWDTTEPDSPPVRHWEVFRDGALVTEAVSPRAGDKPPRPGVYVYTAVALGEDGQRSGESIPWTAVVSPPEAPLPPSRLTGISTAGRVDLRWEPAIAHSVGVVRWQIFRDRAPVGEATSTYARDVPHRPGFYQYTVLAIGEDGQRSAQSVPCTVEVVAGGRPRWLVPAVALSALILATAGLLVWAPWQASSAPLPPAGLTGEVSGTTIQLRWQPAPAGLAAVRRWEVRRDGVLIGKATEPRWAGSVPGPGLYAYTVVAFGEDGQQSVESDSWTSPPAWVKMTDTGFQQSFTAAGVASYNGELWIVGGFGADSLPREEVRRFNPKSEKWLSGPPLPIGIHHGALVSTDDQLFLLGGVAGSDLVPTNIVYRLNDPNGEWVEVEDAPLRAPRYAGSAAWDGQRLVFAGGAEQLCRNCPRPAMGDVWALENQLWVDVDQLTQPRAHLRAVVDDGGTISFVGGADVSKGRVFADVDVLRDDTVERGTPMSTALEGMAAIWTSDTGICTFGGSTSLPNDIPKPVAAVNCSDGPDWPDLPKARMFVGAAVIGDTVYIVGGHPNLDVSDMVLALRFR